MINKMTVILLKKKKILQLVLDYEDIQNIPGMKDRMKKFNEDVINIRQ